MELLLKVYLRRGPPDMTQEKAWGHDLGKLFMKWDDPGRNVAHPVPWTQVCLTRRA